MASNICDICNNEGNLFYSKDYISVYNNDIKDNKVSICENCYFTLLKKRAQYLLKATIIITVILGLFTYLFFNTIDNILWSILWSIFVIGAVFFMLKSYLFIRNIPNFDDNLKRKYARRLSNLKFDILNKTSLKIAVERAPGLFDLVSFNKQGLIPGLFTTTPDMLEEIQGLKETTTHDIPDETIKGSKKLIIPEIIDTIIQEPINTKKHKLSRCRYFYCPKCKHVFTKESNLRGWKFFLDYPSTERTTILGTLTCQYCGYVFQCHAIYNGKHDLPKKNWKELPPPYEL